MYWIWAVEVQDLALSYLIRAAKAILGLRAQAIWSKLPSKIYRDVTKLLHYLEDLEHLFLKVQQTLKPNGRFVFSVEHPVITSTLQPSGKRSNWIVDQYFIEGFREQQWLGGTVHKYHRTIEQYFAALQQAGLTIEQLRESKPQRSNFLHDETYERRLRIPLFFFLAARKS